MANQYHSYRRRIYEGYLLGKTEEDLSESLNISIGQICKYFTEFRIAQSEIDSAKNKLLHIKTIERELFNHLDNMNQTKAWEKRYNNLKQSYSSFLC